jgi:exodeoxyribonuclease VII small subunit
MLISAALMATDEKEERFEESLARLEALIKALDAGDLPLERSLEVFEESVGLLKKCQAKLDLVQTRIEILERERNSIRAVPFAPQAKHDSKPPEPGDPTPF